MPLFPEEESRVLKNFLEYVRNRPVEDAEIISLLNCFGSLCGVLEAGAHMLEKAGLSSQEAQMLALVPDLSRYTQRYEHGEHPKLMRLTDASAYVRALFMGIHIERFYALSLNSGGRLLRAAMLQQGTYDETPFYLDALLRQVIDDNASAVILTHNHPAGSPYPSEADLKCTHNAQNALKALDVCLLDHIIVAAGRCVSFRQNGYFTITDAQNMRAYGLYQSWLGDLSD